MKADGDYTASNAHAMWGGPRHAAQRQVQPASLSSSTLWPWWHAALKSTFSLASGIPLTQCCEAGDDHVQHVRPLQASCMHGSGSMGCL